MTSDEEYDYNEYDNSFMSQLRSSLNISTISDWLLVFLIGGSILILSGLIYIFTETPEFIGRDSRGSQVVYNSVNISGLGRMFVIEMLIVSGTIIIGVIGLYLIRYATSYVDEREKGVQVLVIGIIMFIGALFLLYLVYNFKITSQFPNLTGTI